MIWEYPYFWKYPNNQDSCQIPAEVLRIYQQPRGGHLRSQRRAMQLRSLNAALGGISGFPKQLFLGQKFNVVIYMWEFN